MRRQPFFLVRWVTAIPRWIGNSILPSAALLVGYIATTGEDAYTKWWYVGIGVSVLLTAAVPFYNMLFRVVDRHAENEAMDRELRALLDVDDMFKPLLDRVCDVVVDKGDSDAALNRAISTALEGLTKLLAQKGSGRVRACYYQVSADGASLTLKTTVGRARDRPGQTIDSSDVRGRDTLKTLRARQTVTYSNLAKAKPPGWKPNAGKRKEYKCFSRAAVHNEQGIYGILTVDSNVAEEINERDEPAINLTAAALALALAARESRG